MSEDKNEITFEMIKQNLFEISEMQKKSSIEAEKRQAEWEKRDKALSEKIDKVSKHIRGIDLSNGAMAEEAIFHSLERKMNFGGIDFDDIHQKVSIVSGFKTMTELDVLMVNGDTVAIIEAKYKVEKEDVIDLLKTKLTHFRNHNPDYKNHKIILGIGGMSFLKDAEALAKNKGIGIIRVVGDKVEYNTEGIQIY